MPANARHIAVLRWAAIAKSAPASTAASASSAVK
jgi:hypothetical protein